MKILMNGMNLKITDSMKSIVSEKLNSLSKFIDEDTEVSVKVTQKKIEVKLVVMLVYNGKLIKVTERDEDFYVAVDKMTDTLKMQVKKLHALKVKRETDQSKTIRTYFDENIEDEILEEPHISKRKHIRLSPMTESEAIEIMESLGHSAFVFLNADNDCCISLLYKRNDGDYGILLDTE